MEKEYKVAKFGGSSIANIENINKVVKAIEKTYKPKNLCLIFSAHGGVTDKLINLYSLAYNQENTEKEIQGLENKHYDIIDHFLNKKNANEGKEIFKRYFQEIRDLCFSIKTLKEYSNRINDKLVSYGELMSNTFFTFYLSQKYKKVNLLDTREVIKTNSDFGYAQVNFNKTKTLIKDYVLNKNGIIVCTGFIASDDEAVTTTLGRSGSDYTASIIAEAIQAKHLDIWTDVDGIMTTDPRMESEAYYLPKVSYKEAMEMSHFGAKVIFSSTMLPAMRRNIPIAIKNTFNINHPGTVIHKFKKRPPYDDTIKGVSSISNVSMLTLQGVGLNSKSDISQRFFKTLVKYKTNIILITQASSEYSLCVCTKTKEAIKVLPAINEEFQAEIKNKSIEYCKCEDGLAIVAVIGEAMKHKIGSSGKLFSALGRAGVNVIAIAQGSSELNISTVIQEKNLVKSINVLHDTFFLSNTKRVYLFLFGIGKVGKKLLEIIKNQKEEILKQYKVNIILGGFANSQKMMFNEKGFNLETPFNTHLQKAQPSNMKNYVNEMLSLNKANSIFIDCTANEDIISFYSTILSKGVSIVTPNKKANSSDTKTYNTLRKFSSSHANRFCYETSVGAGLPIINTIQDLVLSGDEIIKIEAVLSGTMNYLFSNYDSITPFSQLVYEAKEKGFTEPDPREDLNGMDVARKILILIREAGNQMELSDIKVSSLVTTKLLKNKSLKAFYNELTQMDEYYKKIYSNALKQKKRLRYAAKFNGKKAEVGIVQVDEKHPFYRLQGTDNIIIITSKRYHSQPMIIKGPGAGIDVTSAGVFADIIRGARQT